MVLDTSLLNTQQYKLRIEGEVAPSPTPRCSSYWKGSLLVALDYGRQLYFTYYTNVEEPNLPYYLPIVGGRMVEFINFPGVSALCEMQIAFQGFNQRSRYHFVRH